MPSDPAEMSTRQLRRGLLSERRACGECPELFFPPPDDEDQESAVARMLREQAAITLCMTCPVRSLCLEYALRTVPEHGVWAGYTAEEIAVFANDLEEVA